GSPNSLGAHALHASLSLLLEIGMPTISDMVSRNIEYLIDKYNEHGLEILSPTEPERRAGIIVFRHPDLSSEALYRHLQTRNVLCALRGGGIRFSPHFYTPKTALDRALKLVCGAADILS
ncbi:MAG: aminotransferase, partial [Chromatiales bacterium]